MANPLDAGCEVADARHIYDSFVLAQERANTAETRLNFLIWGGDVRFDSALSLWVGSRGAFLCWRDTPEAAIDAAIAALGAGRGGE